MKKIVAFHLYNDFSGSPKALKTVLEKLLVRGYSVDLYTSAGGVLDSLSDYENCRITHCRYRFSENSLKTILSFFIVQITIFFKAFRYLTDKNCVFYINTIMPIGAAAAARLMKKKLVYHYHENAYIRGRMYRILARCMEAWADRIMCVSAYQSSFLSRSEGVVVIPNALEASFISQLQPDIDAAYERKTVLVLSSLKEYKGLIEFFQLAAMNPQLSFVAVINDTDENIEEFISKHKLVVTPNLTYHSRQQNVARFYNNASLSLNLTRKTEAVETFGLTALEAMSNALPVIVPTVGGIAEMVEDDVNGYKIDVEDLDKISEKISLILSDSELYNRLAGNAIETSGKYSLNNAIQQIEMIINKI